MAKKRGVINDAEHGPNPVHIAAWMALVIMVVWLLHIGRSFLIPLVLAFLAFYLVQVLNGFWRETVFRRWKMPVLLFDVISTALILGLMLAFSSLVARNAVQVAETAPSYGPRIAELYEQGVVYLGIEEASTFSERIARINLGEYVRQLALGMLSLLGNGFLVVLYLVFMLLERPFFMKKLHLIVRDRQGRNTVDNVLADIDESARAYLGIKTLTSLLTAALSYFVMWYVGLDFAGFWAVVIFVFNYIPNIGSPIATVLPSALALVQYDTLRPFIIVLGGITIVQGVVGNLLEPQLMSDALNMSPLVVVLSLVFWGALWGVVGMFLCVPITSMMIIVFSNIDQTRWVAVLLSRSGQVLPARGHGRQRAR